MKTQIRAVLNECGEPARPVARLKVRYSRTQKRDCIASECDGLVPKTHQRPYTHLQGFYTCPSVILLAMAHGSAPDPESHGRGNNDTIICLRQLGTHRARMASSSVGAETCGGKLRVRAKRRYVGEKCRAKICSRSNIVDSQEVEDKPSILYLSGSCVSGKKC
jgi:hypothetical protein